jgi:hypothetical protein
MENSDIEKDIISFLFSLSKKELLLLKDIENIQVLYNRLSDKFKNQNILFYIKIVSIYVAIFTTIQFNNVYIFKDIDKLFNDVFDLDQLIYNKKTEKSNFLINEYLHQHYQSFNEYLNNVFIIDVLYDKTFYNFTTMNIYHKQLLTIKSIYVNTYTSLKNIFLNIFIKENNEIKLRSELSEKHLDYLLEECRDILSEFYIQYENLHEETNKAYNYLKKDILLEVTKLRIDHLKSQFIA